MNQDATRQPATHDEIIAITGPLDDLTVAEIIKMGATPAEVLEAWTWLGADDALGQDPGHSLSSRVAAIYDLLAPQPEEEDDRG